MTYMRCLGCCLGCRVIGNPSSNFQVMTWCKACGNGAAVGHMGSVWFLLDPRHMDVFIKSYECGLEHWLRDDDRLGRFWQGRSQNAQNMRFSEVERVI